MSPAEKSSVRTRAADLRRAISDIDAFVDERWDAIRGNPAADRIFYAASEAADFSVLWHALGVAQAIRRDDLSTAVALSAALGAESALINGPVKSLFRRSRPAEGSPAPYRLRTPRTTSFPSGHASAAMVAATMLSRRGKAPLWYSLGAVVAASRIHVRIHHASDVAAGALAGLLIGRAARRLAVSVRPGR